MTGEDKVYLAVFTGGIGLVVVEVFNKIMEERKEKKELIAKLKFAEINNRKLKARIAELENNY